MSRSMLASLITFTVTGSVEWHVTPRSLMGLPLSFSTLPSMVVSRKPNLLVNTCSVSFFCISMVRRV